MRSNVIVGLAVLGAMALGIWYQPEQTPIIVGLGGIIGVGLLNLIQVTTAAIKATEAVAWASSAAGAASLAASRIDELVVVAGNTQRMGEATHTLVNSNMGVQLRIAATALRRVAELTKAAGDIAAAELAERQLKEHTGKQEEVDDRPDPRPTESGKAGR